MDIFWNIIIIIIIINIIIINIINYFKSCVFLLGKVADCSSFFQLCLRMCSFFQTLRIESV